MATELARRNKRQRESRKRAERKNALWKALLAEVVGTFFLTFAAASPIVVAAITGKLQNLDEVIPPGATVGALIYALGPVSGAHFNPAVTLAFASRRSFPWKLVPLYWLSQLLGALAGGIILLTFGNVKHVGATTPDGGIMQSLVLEVILTTLLCLVILGTSNDHKISGNNAALAVGSTIALCGMIGGPISGASMNPARSLGPAIVGGTLPSAWIYVLGPAIGVGIAVVLTNLVHKTVTKSERKAAIGQKRVGDSQTTDGHSNDDGRAVL